MGVLEGTKILDFSRVLAGPYCTALLAELGADVVKVESPNGDDARHLGPFLRGESTYFAALNRGKRSIVLDLKKPDDLRVATDLAASADVVVENFRPGVADRLGVGWAALSRINPRLVYLSISGFGQTGPMATLPAYDLIIQALSGIMAATGKPEDGPTRVGESIGDVAAGLFGALGVLAALHGRGANGEGHRVDLSMLESLMALQVTGLSMINATGAPGPRVGNRHPVSAPFDTYQAQDGMVAIAVANNSMFARLAHMMHQPHLITDPRFRDEESRSTNVRALTTAMQEWTKTLTVDQIVTLAGASGIPASPIWNLHEAIKCPQVSSRETIGTQVHSVLGPQEYVRLPFRLGDLNPMTPSPALGQDAVAIREDWLGQDPTHP